VVSGKSVLAPSDLTCLPLFPLLSPFPLFCALSVCVQALCGVGVPVLFEPTSVPKSLLPITSKCLPHVTITKPNLQELLTVGTQEKRLLIDS
jgi:hypothetical protein